eukprot:jgi/Botrbrau1/22483/Bobra.114_2s0012.2
MQRLAGLVADSLDGEFWSEATCKSLRLEGIAVFPTPPSYLSLAVTAPGNSCLVALSNLLEVPDPLRLALYRPEETLISKALRDGTAFWSSDSEKLRDIGLRDVDVARRSGARHLLCCPVYGPRASSHNACDPRLAGQSNTDAHMTGHGAADSRVAGHKADDRQGKGGASGLQTAGHNPTKARVDRQRAGQHADGQRAGRDLMDGQRAGDNGEGQRAGRKRRTVREVVVEQRRSSSRQRAGHNDISSSGTVSGDGSTPDLHKAGHNVIKGPGAVAAADRQVAGQNITSKALVPGCGSAGEQTAGHDLEERQGAGGPSVGDGGPLGPRAGCHAGSLSPRDRPDVIGVLWVGWNSDLDDFARCKETVVKLADALPRHVARYGPELLKEVSVFLPADGGKRLSGDSARGGRARAKARRQLSCNLPDDRDSQGGPKPDSDDLLALPNGRSGGRSPAGGPAEMVPGDQSPKGTSPRKKSQDAAGDPGSPSDCGTRSPGPSGGTEIVSGSADAQASVRAETEFKIAAPKGKAPLSFAQNHILLNFHDPRLEYEYRRYFGCQAISHDRIICFLVCMGVCLTAFNPNLGVARNWSPFFLVQVLPPIFCALLSVRYPMW